MRTNVKAIIASFAFVTLFFVTQNVFAQTTVSDNELKKNATPVANSLSVIEQIQPISFEFNKDKFKKLNLPDGVQYGFNVDELQQVIPAAVTKEHKWYSAGKNNPKAVSVNAVNYDVLIPLLVSAIKEQQAEIDSLKMYVKQLKAK